MKIRKLLQNIPSIVLKGYKDIEITSLCNNSKQAGPGSLFFAKKGLTRNGNQFVSDAVSAGAQAIATDLYNPFLEGVVQIIHPDIAELESLLGSRFYGSPSEKLLAVGITGTNGKTTTSYLIKHLLDNLDLPAGLIGTIEWIVKESVFPSVQTTPDALTNRKLLREMVWSGCKSVVMEVSSHGIDQGRVKGIDFDIAVFTNLTQDHLDYHGDMQSYGEAKAKLFASLASEPSKEKKYPKAAVVNADCPSTPLMIEHCKARVFTYGIRSDADLTAQRVELSTEGSTCILNYQKEKFVFRTPLIGMFNLYNCLAAIATALVLGFDLAKAVSLLSSFRSVPGRMERVENEKQKTIFVDYAHTEDALKNVLETLREVTKGRLVCVFGCGGNRDRLKRPKMGAAAERYADLLIVTSDNPRGEPPDLVIEEIVRGIQNPSKVQREPDRKKAIGLAVSLLRPDDVLLIAGKGHESSQIFSGHTVRFDDRIVAMEYCQS